LTIKITLAILYSFVRHVIQSLFNNDKNVLPKFATTRAIYEFSQTWLHWSGINIYQVVVVFGSIHMV